MLAVGRDIVAPCRGAGFKVSVEERTRLAGFEPGASRDTDGPHSNRPRRFEDQVEQFALVSGPRCIETAVGRYGMLFARTGKARTQSSFRPVSFET